MTKDEALDKAQGYLDGLIRGLNMDDTSEAVQVRDAIKQARALDKKAENARELGLDYEPVAIDANMRNVLHGALKRSGKVIPPPAQPAPVQPVQEPVLQDIEQYRLQMAGISTAAIGYWKEGDGIHPDYDTPALRDVAKLYAKYDALYTAAQPAPVQEPDRGDELTIAYMSGLHDGKKKREWVGLTDEEADNFLKAVWGREVTPKHFIQAIEAKLKEKNT